MKKKIKVLQVIPRLGFGGAETGLAIGNGAAAAPRTGGAGGSGTGARAAREGGGGCV